jgi:excisionase family DNA binding protein
MMNTTEAAKMAGLSVRRVQRLCQQGRIGVRFGRYFYIAEEEMKTFMKEKREAGNPQWTKTE